MEIYNSPHKLFALPRLGALLALFCIFIWVGPSHAEMYKWTDEAGQVHFTDNLFNIPQQYLNQIKTFRETRAGTGDPADIPLQKTPMGYIVDAKLNGQVAIKLVVDTGASTTVISPAALERAGATVSMNPPVLIRTAGGEKTVGRAELQSLGVGDLRKGPITVVAHDVFKEVDGLLGMDFMGSYRVEIMTVGPLLRLTLP